MKQMNCSQEGAVARAAATATWPEALAAHAKQCAICRDVAQTAHWMRALATPTEEDGSADMIAELTRPLPDPGLVWQMARLENANSRKGGATVEWLQTGSAAAAPVLLAGWVAWNWFSIETVAGQFLLNTWPQLSMVAFMLAALAPAALTIAALALGYPLLAGD